MTQQILNRSDTMAEQLKLKINKTSIEEMDVVQLHRMGS